MINYILVDRENKATAKSAKNVRFLFNSEFFSC